jgi:hypothetical protein
MEKKESKGNIRTRNLWLLFLVLPMALFVALVVSYFFGRGGMMTVSQVWHTALSIIADFSPMTYWQMSNGAAFWWTLTNRAQLRDERFAEEPFFFAEIVSVYLVSEVHLHEELLTCDWPALRQSLLNVPGLRVQEMRDFKVPPASPPNKALHLTAAV